jgi:anti-sigma-K factor RskA
MTEAHEHWEELAAGHALSALEPDEEAAFLAHLATCESCAEVLADHALVAAQLGALVDDAEEAPSWERIRAGILPSAPLTAPVADVASLDEARTRRRAPLLLRAAAAAVLVTGAGAVWLASSGSSPDPQQVAVSACSSQPGCHVLSLQGKARLIVSGGTVRLLSSSLQAPSSGQQYVLWQQQRGGEMTLVGSLRATEPGTVGEAHSLALPYEDTAGFGLSVEPAGVVPTRPGTVVAVTSD